MQLPIPADGVLGATGHTVPQHAAVGCGIVIGSATRHHPDMEQNFARLVIALFYN